MCFTVLVQLLSSQLKPGRPDSVVWQEKSCDINITGPTV